MAISSRVDQAARSDGSSTLFWGGQRPPRPRPSQHSPRSMPAIWRPNLGRKPPPASAPVPAWVIGLGTDSDDDTGAPVNPIKSREVCDAVKGDAPEAARKQGGWVGKRKRNTGRKGGGWLSETPRVVDDERTGPGGFEPTRNPERGIFTHLPRTPEEALSEFNRQLLFETKRYRFLMVMMTHATSCRDSTSCGVLKCDSVKRHLRHARRCVDIACTDRICPHVKFLLHHRRECADGDGCYVCAAARERENMEFTVIGGDDDDEEEREEEEEEEEKEVEEEEEEEEGRRRLYEGQVRWSTRERREPTEWWRAS